LPSVCLIAVKPFQSLREYETFIDTLSQRFSSQPHANDPALASTDPHHRHVPPDIKHHRIPAPALTFTSPNLPVLIHEIERLEQQPK
jgi:hypothetical protein